MRNRLPLLLCSAWTALFGTACGTTYFTVTRRAPAEIDIPAGMAIAVAEIQGEEGDALANELTQALVESRRFQVLERQRLEAAMRELAFSAAGHVSDATAMSFGQMTGAATLVVGQVEEAGYGERVEEATEPCEDGECTRRTRLGTTKLRVNLKVIETETGKVLAAKNLEAQQRRRTTAVNAEPPAIVEQAEMRQQCRSELVRRFMTVISPYDRQVQVALRSDDDLPELETGNNYARIGNWEAAVEQYRSAVSKAEAGALPPKKLAKALYNLGVGLGYSGRYDEGIGHIERAYAQDPDSLYRQQVQQIRAFKEESARLRAQEGGTI